MVERVLVELATDDDAARAIRSLRGRGITVIDAYAPYPSHVIEDAFDRKPSLLPIAVFVAGMIGASGGYLLQWLLVAKLYPLVVGMRPPHAPWPFLIITFEMGVLCAAVAAFVGTLVVGRLVRLTDAVQGTPGFESATRDRFWLELANVDDATLDLLPELGATRVEVVR